MTIPSTIGFVDRESRYKESIAYMERARRQIPRGVMSYKRSALRPVPLAFASAQGSHIVDVDGNDYIDYVAGYGPLLLGHRFGPVDEAVIRQLSKGTLFGGQHEGEAALAELLVEVVPSAENVLLNVTGSEADHAAVRLARAATGRHLIARFEGNYHGWIDPLASGKQGFQFTNEDVLTCRWNDAESLRVLLENNPGEVAAVILEPIAVNSGAMVPDEGFLLTVRELCTQHGALLIFDEVITGFRVALGGAQELFGVAPDLTVLGKAIASGHQLSAIVGRAEVFDAARTEVAWAGTMNGQSLAVSAALATVSYISENRDSIYSKLDSIGSTLVDGINRAGDLAGVPLTATRVGGMVRLYWGTPEPRNRHENVLQGDAESLARFSGHLVDLGIHAREGGLWYISNAHTESDVQSTLEAVDQALVRTLSSAGGPGTAAKA